MYKTQTLEELKDLYKVELKKYNAQEKWIESNPDKAHKIIKGKIPFKMFLETLSNLGQIGYEMEDRFNYIQSTEERFGELGPFQKEVVERLGL